RHDTAEGIERLAYAHDGYRWKGLRHRLDERRFFRDRAAARIGQGGDVHGRRAAEGRRREYHHEIDAKALPVERAQIDGPCGYVAVEHSDRDGIAEFEPQPLRHLLLEGYERRPVIVRRPPGAVAYARSCGNLG